MTKKAMDPNSVWIDITHLDQPRSWWIWWVIEGSPEAPKESSRTFTSFRDLKYALESQGYRVPSSSEIDRLVAEARADGLLEAKIKVSRPSKG